MKKVNKVKLLKYINKPIFFIMLGFAIFGALCILDASSISSVLTYGESPYYFFRKQVIFIIGALLMSLVIIKFDTKTYGKISFILSLLFMIILFVIDIKNKIFTTDVSEVSINLGIISIQPAEFLKVFIVMYMGSFYGSWVNNPNRKKWTWIIPLIICAAAVGLIAFGGDYGSAAIMIALFALVFICVPSDDKNIHTLKIIAIGGLVFAILALKFSYLIIGEDTLSSNYRLNRFIYTNPCDRYEENSGYQVCNGYIAIDNGNLFGVGIGDSTQKYLYLPASHTDFIFPIIVEEIGVIPSTIIILLYMLLLYLIFKVSTQCNKLQNSIICYGIGIYITLHIFINLGGVLGIIPLTGVPLPFLSSGGSFCLALICSLAVVQRINIENRISKLKE